MSEAKIIAENEWLIAINKPAGLITHSDGRTKEPSLSDWILARYPELAAVGEPWISPQGETVLRPGLVHRLDRTTSGVMIVAKTPEAYAYLKSEFKGRRVKKTYRAFVYGRIEPKGRIVAEIMRSPQPPRRWYARDCPESGKRAAVTEWALLEHRIEADVPYSYIEARPLTGRTHQIRVHFAYIGHPIVGDHLYAPDMPPILGFNRPALHAHNISLILPSGESVTYSAPLPAGFVE